MSQYTEDDLYRQQVANTNGHSVMRLALQQARANPSLTISQAIIGAYTVAYVQGIRERIV